MKKFTFISLTIVLILISSVQAQISVKATTNSQNLNDKYVFIETSNIEQYKHMVRWFDTNQQITTYSSMVANEDGKYLLVVASKEKVLSKDKAARDCLIGAGACLANGLFVGAVGEENKETGQIELEDGDALLSCGLSALSLVFGVKGIIELFKKRTKNKTVKNATMKQYPTKSIITANGLMISDEKEFDIQELEEIDSKIIPFVISRI